jgi:5-methylcytosine-specific restriction endonuclease McrA
MPFASPTACTQQPCPHPAVARGRCAIHQRTTSQRGYGTDHQVERRAALPGARCERCGCTRNLQRDHRIPTTLGGSQASSNKRWLCRCPEHRCHDVVGLRSDSVA